MMKKVTQDGEVSIGTFFDLYTVYGAVAIQGAVRFRKFQIGDVADCLYTFSKLNISLHKPLLDKSGIAKGDNVRIYINDNGDVFVYKPSEFNNPLAFNKLRDVKFQFEETPANVFAEAGSTDTIRMSLNKNMPSATLMKLIGGTDIAYDSDVICSLYNTDDRCWLDIRPATDCDKHIAPKSAMKDVMLAMPSKQINGITYQDKLKIDKLLLTGNFLKRIFKPGSDILAWVDSRKHIIIEASIENCLLCENELRATSSRKKVIVCPKCAKHLGSGNALHSISESMSVVKAANEITLRSRDLSAEIYDLGFSTRTLNALLRNDIKTADDLMKLNFATAICLKGVGSKSALEISEKIKELAK